MLFACQLIRWEQSKLLNCLEVLWVHCSVWAGIRWWAHYWWYETRVLGTVNGVNKLNVQFNYNLREDIFSYCLTGEMELCIVQTQLLRFPPQGKQKREIELKGANLQVLLFCFWKWSSYIQWKQSTLRWWPVDSVFQYRCLWWMANYRADSQYPRIKKVGWNRRSNVMSWFCNGVYIFKNLVFYITESFRPRNDFASPFLTP